MNINEENIFEIIIEFMRKAEKEGKISGNLKKQITLQLIKESIGIEAFKRYEPFINASIEFIINISHGMKIKGINKKICCFNR
jgi:hypothetical protein